MNNKIVIQSNPSSEESLCTKPQGFLAKTLFPKYLEATRLAFAQYDGKNKQQIISIDNIKVFISACNRRGLDVLITDKAAEQVENFSKKIVETVSNADKHLLSFEQELQERGFSLYEHQREGIKWLLKHNRTLLFDDMGLGKTLQVLGALPKDCSAVVVCPSCVKGNWYSEVQHWRPDLTPKVLSGKRSFKMPKKNEVVILNYEILPDDIPGTPEGLYLIADEAQYLKNPNSQRSNKFIRMTKKASHIWMLTGTPLMNKPPDLWNILKAAGLERKAYGNWNAFLHIFSGRKSMYGYKWGKPRDTSVIGLRRVALGRKKEDVLDLPGKTQTTHIVPIVTTRTLDKLFNKVKRVAEDEDAIESIKKKISFDTISEIRKAMARLKIPHMMKHIELFEDDQVPLVVFSAHLEPIEALEGRPGWGIITGNTPSHVRHKIVQQFQDGHLVGVAGTIQAMGTGITLTRASNMLFVDKSWTPADNEQAEDRIYRIGQNDKCQYITLVANHKIDVMVAKCLQGKQRVMDNSVNKASGSNTQVLHTDFSSVLGLPRCAPVGIPGGTALSTGGQPRRCLNPAKAIRSAQTVQEKWAEHALRTLSASDPDRAMEVNGIGFNKMDGPVGHSLVGQLPLLTDKQWELVVTICKRYPRQVGSCPK